MDTKIESPLMLNLVIVGAGGIGTFLLAALSRHLLGNVIQECEIRSMTVIDGDNYESKNLSRQFFSESAIGRNKAEAQIDKFRMLFPKTAVSLESGTEYITEENINGLLQGRNTIIFSCVDNHAARLVLSRYAEQYRMDNCVLITGGNNEFDGSVHIQGDFNGYKLGAPIEQIHPEILTDKTDDRGAMSCQELGNMKDGEQLVVANMGAAYFMYAAFLSLLYNPGALVDVEDVFFDAKAYNFRAVRRPTVVKQTVSPPPAADTNVKAGEDLDLDALDL